MRMRFCCTAAIRLLGCSGCAKVGLFAFCNFRTGEGRYCAWGLPGEILSAPSLFSPTELCSVQALTDIRVCSVGRAAFIQALTPDSAIAVAFSAEITAADVAAGQLLLAVGRMSAEERTGFLLVHLLQRLSAAGAVIGNSCPMPLRQQHIADALGLTPVHVSRVMGRFRELNICRLTDGVLEVLDLAQLERIGAMK